MSIFSCQDNVRRMSQALDGGLSLRQRLALRVHLLGCPMCSRFRRQLQFLHRAAKQFEDNADAGSSALSAEARARIQNAIEGENT